MTTTEIIWGDTYPETNAVFKREFARLGKADADGQARLREAHRLAMSVIAERDDEARKKAAREAEKAKELETMFPKANEKPEKPVKVDRRCVVCDVVLIPTGKAGRPATKCPTHATKKKTK